MRQCMGVTARIFTNLPLLEWLGLLMVRLVKVFPHLYTLYA